MSSTVKVALKVTVRIKSFNWRSTPRRAFFLLSTQNRWAGELIWPKKFFEPFRPASQIFQKRSYLDGTIFPDLSSCSAALSANTVAHIWHNRWSSHFVEGWRSQREIQYLKDNQSQFLKVQKFQKKTDFVPIRLQRILKQNTWWQAHKYIFWMHHNSTESRYKNQICKINC